MAHPYSPKLKQCCIKIISFTISKHYIIAVVENTMRKNFLIMLVAVAIGSTTFVACSNAVAKTSSAIPETGSNGPMNQTKDIVDVAVGSPDHSTLVAAV